MKVGSSQITGRLVFRGRVLALTLVLGILSILLYLLLFQFSDQLNTWAEATRQGAKIYALIPLIIAMLFAFVHGTFVDYLWDLLGLRAKK